MEKLTDGTRVAQTDAALLHIVISFFIQQKSFELCCALIGWFGLGFDWNIPFNVIQRYLSSIHFDHKL